MDKYLKRVSYRVWLDWAYPFEGWVFWRKLGEENDADIEFYQARPNKRITAIINKL